MLLCLISEALGSEQCEYLKGSGHKKKHTSTLTCALTLKDYVLQWEADELNERLIYLSHPYHVSGNKALKWGEPEKTLCGFHFLELLSSPLSDNLVWASKDIFIERDSDLLT